MEEQVDYSSQNLLELRSNAKLSRRAFLDRLDEHGVKMHPTTLRRIEDGEQNLKVSEALAVAAVFDITLDKLVTAPIDEREAVLISYLRGAQAFQEALIGTASDWINMCDEMPKLLTDPAMPKPNNSKPARDLQAYIEATAKLREWFRSMPVEDFPRPSVTDLGGDNGPR